MNNSSVRRGVVGCGLVLGFSLLLGCGTTSLTRTYPGPEQPLDAVALVWGKRNRVNILSVDGASVDSLRERYGGRAISLALLPGRHELGVHAVANPGASDSTGTLMARWLLGERVENAEVDGAVIVELDAGGQYEIQARVRRGKPIEMSTWQKAVRLLPLARYRVVNWELHWDFIAADCCCVECYEKFPARACPGHCSAN